MEQDISSAVVTETNREHVGKPLGVLEAAERWRVILDEQRVSGLPVSVFCRQRGIGQSTLFAWRRRLAGTGQRMMFKAVKVVPVARQPSRRHRAKGDAGTDAGAGIDASLELCLPGGLRVMVRRGFDRGLLLELVDALEGRS